MPEKATAIITEPQDNPPNDEAHPTKYPYELLQRVQSSVVSQLRALSEEYPQGELVVVQRNYKYSSASDGQEAGETYFFRVPGENGSGRCFNLTYSSKYPHVNPNSRAYWI